MTKFGEVIAAEKPILIDFYAEWCEPCRTMQPVLRDVAAALGDKARVIKIDVDKNQKLAATLKVKGVPTLMIYKEGEMKWRRSGVQDANTLISMVEKYM